MSILYVGKKTWQMQTQMLISWVLIPVGIAQHVTRHIYVIAQYPTTAGLCKLTSFSRSDCRDLVSLEWTFLLKKPQTTFPTFKTLNVEQAASQSSHQQSHWYLPQFAHRIVQTPTTVPSTWTSCIFPVQEVSTVHYHCFMKQLFISYSLRNTMEKDL